MENSHFDSLFYAYPTLQDKQEVTLLRLQSFPVCFTLVRILAGSRSLHHPTAIELLFNIDPIAVDPSRSLGIVEYISILGDLKRVTVEQYRVKNINGKVWAGIHITVEPPNKGHFGTTLYTFFSSRLPPLGGQKCIRTIRTTILEPQVLSQACTEIHYTVSLFGRVHYRRPPVQ